MLARLTSSVLGFVLAIGLIVLAGWAVVRGVEAEPSVVGSFATALSAVVVVLVARDREKRLDLQQSDRDRMAPIYEELFQRVTQADLEEPTKQEDVFRQVHHNLLFYGPTPVLKAWLSFVRAIPEDGESDLRRMLGWENVLFAIRKDLGHDNSDFKQGDLLRLYINDIDDHLAQLRNEEAQGQRQ